MTESDSIAVVRALAAAKRLPETHLARWLAMAPESRDGFLAAARDLRMRTGQIVTALDLLDEISVRERTNPAAILARPMFKQIIGGPGSAPARARAMLEALRAARYPRLAAALEKLRAEIAALKLPRSISVAIPKDLVSDELEISLKVRSAADLDRTLAALAQRKDGLARIIDLLTGES
jgi:hypothetical protein